MSNSSLRALGLAVALTIPWVVLWLCSELLPMLGLHAPVTLHELGPSAVVAVSGLAVLGGAFLLAWAAETAEKDVPRAFAIAVLAILAVAPEYAVDALYAWNAGIYEGTQRGIEAGNLAVANMTGANRILIGIGWAGIALFTVLRAGAASDPAVQSRSGWLRDSISIDTDISLDVVFLFGATVWAFFVPFNGGIDALDMLILVGIYVIYILVVLRGDVESEEAHVGVPAYLQSFPKPKRIGAVITLFVYAGALIFTAVEPFAHGLETIGTGIGVPSFFMIQWIAPLASESPELIVVLYLVNKARSTAGFNALISSKLNQWTLLIGTLVVVHSLALGEYGVLAFDAKQAAEIWLTAAQSYFALAILINFQISIREAIGLLVLFVSQVVLEYALIQNLIALPVNSHDLLLVFTGIYLVIGTVLLVMRRHAFVELLQRTTATVTAAFSLQSETAVAAEER
ncbi:sodium:calcium antiporter [Halocatena halophila]|uniref:sodium:calcium antiporter n=1 Tax=Halocatena halophila TaxID=2814576 RepID=UPI002ED3B77E